HVVVTRQCGDRLLAVDGPAQDVAPGRGRQCVEDTVDLRLVEFSLCNHLVVRYARDLRVSRPSSDRARDGGAGRRTGEQRRRHRGGSVTTCRDYPPRDTADGRGGEGDPLRCTPPTSDAPPPRRKRDDVRAVTSFGDLAHA